MWRRVITEIEAFVSQCSQIIIKQFKNETLQQLGKNHEEMLASQLLELNFLCVTCLVSVFNIVILL